MEPLLQALEAFVEEVCQFLVLRRAWIDLVEDEAVSSALAAGFQRVGGRLPRRETCA